MKSTIRGLMIVGLLAGPMTTQADVTFSTDTETDLVGTFWVTGTSADSATPSAFDFGLSFCLPVRASRGTTATVGLQCAGSRIIPASACKYSLARRCWFSQRNDQFAALVAPSRRFYFLFSDLQDTGSGRHLRGILLLEKFDGLHFVRA
jgi:hypothetical protein